MAGRARVTDIESMAEYQARKAVSAGFLWRMVNDCPAQAYWESCFNPASVREEARHFDDGIALHCAVLEPHLLARQIVEIDADNYRTKAAQEARDRAYLDGRTPMLASDWAKVQEMRLAIERSDAAELFFGDGQSEVSYTWEWDGVPCKARADRIAGGHLIDLKTAVSASPRAFQRAMIRDGHHLRAAWYIDGWQEQGRDDGGGLPPPRDYLFVVVAKLAPHLVSIFPLSERAIEKGRLLYRKGLATFRQCQETGVWPGYGEAAPIELPTWYEYQLADMEAEGNL